MNPLTLLMCVISIPFGMKGYDYFTTKKWLKFIILAIGYLMVYIPYLFLVIPSILNK